MRVIWYTFLNLFCLILTPALSWAAPETPEARHLRQRIEQLKSVATEKAALDSKGPVSEQKLIGSAGPSKPPLQVDVKTEDDGDTDEKVEEGKGGAAAKRDQDDESDPLNIPSAPKIPTKKSATPVAPRDAPRATGTGLPVKPGTALPPLVFPGN